MRNHHSLLRLTLMFLILWGSCFSVAASTRVNGIYYNINSDGATATVTYGSIKYSGNVTIPSTVTISGKSYTVSAIGDNAFMDCVSLTNITIPEGDTYITTSPQAVTSIGSFAFKGCTGLNAIEIPRQVSTIGNNAFNGCTKLNELTLYSGCLTTVGDYAFYGCSGLTKVTIGYYSSTPGAHNDITLGKNAFSNCTSLQEVSLGDNLKTIKESAFYNCTALTRVYLQNYGFENLMDFSFENVYSNPLYYAHHLYFNGGWDIPIGVDVNAEVIRPLVIPEDKTNIGPATFAGCTGITKVTIPNSVTSIEAGAFYGCTGISDISIPNSVTNLGNNAFSHCTGLTSVTIPNSITIINAGVFSDCMGLKNVTLPNTVTCIGPSAFSDCTGLISINLPNSLTIIGPDAFYGCTGLTGNLVIPNKIEVIEEMTFYNCRGLTGVTIPSSVKAIGEHAFMNCSGLTRVDISSLEAWCKIVFHYEAGSIPTPSNPLRYAHHLFLNGNEVKALSIPNTVTTIGTGAFFSCWGLTSVTLPNSVTAINNFAFLGCTGIQSVSLPNSLTSIGEKAFMSCSGLTKIVIPNSVTSIGSHAFDICTGLTDAVIGNSVTTIGSYAFYNCSSLQRVTIGTAATTIGPYAFSYCQALKNLDFNAKRCNNFTASNHPFKGSNLEKISIGTAVEVIPAYFAYQQPALTKVHIPGNVSSIGSYAFAECPALAWVVVTRSTPPGPSTGMFNANQLIYVPNLTNYSNNYYWKSYNLKGMYNIESSLTTATISGNSDIYLFAVDYADNLFMASKNAVTIKGLYPDRNNEVTVTLNIGSDLYEFTDVITTKPLSFSSIQYSSTQTTLNTSFTVNRDEGFVIEACGVDNFAGSINGTTSDKYTIGCKITGLAPNSSYYMRPWVQYKGEKYYGNSQSLYTSSIGVNRNGTVGPTSVNYTATYSAGDAHVTDAFFTFQGNRSKDLRQTGLEPNRNYSYSYTLETKNGNQTNSYSFTTPVLMISTQTARMLTNTTAMLIAETNMADEETSCGFEWRRYDAPDEMPSTRVYCPVYGGVMAGTLKRMTENVYYKYRPFYRSSAGNEYYGNWVAFITADASVEFEPVVYTYNSPAVTQTDATLEGVALRGSDEITEQGFEYWPAGNGTMLNAANQVTRVTASGERMSATVKGLTPGTRYVFRAFATAGGKTKRGAEVEFITLTTAMDVNMDGEVNIADVNAVTNAVLVHSTGNAYDVNGDGEINIADINALIQVLLSGK